MKLFYTHYENIRNEIVKVHKNVHAIKSYEIFEIVQELDVALPGQRCQILKKSIFLFFQATND